MNDKKKEKLKIWVIILMILLFIAAFVIFFLGHYGAAFILFGIFVVILNFLSTSLSMENEVYVYKKSYKNDDKW